MTTVTVGRGELQAVSCEHRRLGMMKCLYNHDCDLLPAKNIA